GYAAGAATGLTRRAAAVTYEWSREGRSGGLCAASRPAPGPIVTSDAHDMMRQGSPAAGDATAGRAQGTQAPAIARSGSAPAGSAAPAGERDRLLAAAAALRAEIGRRIVGQQAVLD